MASNPLDHVVQHPLKEVPMDAVALTPNGVITVLSDHIAMIILSGLLLCLMLFVLSVQNVLRNQHL